MAVKKARTPAKRGAKRTGSPRIRIEFPGPAPSPEQRKQIEHLMGLVEIAFLSITRGAELTKMYVSKRRR